MAAAAAAAEAGRSPDGSNVAAATYKTTTAAPALELSAELAAGFTSSGCERSKKELIPSGQQVEGLRCWILKS